MNSHAVAFWTPRFLLELPLDSAGIAEGMRAEIKSDQLVQRN